MFTIYKPGQGFYTRTVSAIGLSVLTIMGVMWLVSLLANVRMIGGEPIWGQALVAVLVFLVVGAIAYWLIGTNQRTVDFLIATEGEMKKVNWSTRREITGSTTLVIGFTLFLAVVCFLVDTGFQLFFTAVHVLEGAPG